MNVGNKAKEYFCNGFNCAQSTSAPFASVAGLSESDVLSMMAGFGGGLGGLRDLCGAVSGMVWAIGAAGESYDPNDNEAKTQFYSLIKDAVTEFTNEFGSTCCKDLLEKAGIEASASPSVRTKEYYASRPCALFVQRAAEIAAQKIAQRK